MQNILLTGAGFSRNWGGWLANEIFEYLLGCPEVMQSASLRDLLWDHQCHFNGFESALGSLRATAAFEPSKQKTNDFRALEQAIVSAFEHMNERLWEQPLEWFSEPARPMQTFLARFDAIFTLNQDLLGRPHKAYTALPQTDFREQEGLQPLYKLHGSFGWSTTNQDRVLIMGSMKEHDIENFEILTWYHSRFQHMLSQPDTRLMVIGYSFGDQHINQVITDAVQQHRLRFFVVDPAGSGLAPRASPERQLTVQQQTLNDTFRRGLIGASRRTLKETFTSDSVENAKLNRFFECPEREKRLKPS